MVSGNEFLIATVLPVLIGLTHRLRLWHEVKTLIRIAICAGVAYVLKLYEGVPIDWTVIYVTTPAIFGTATASYELLYRRAEKRW